jgi:hypothetical protein
MPADSQFKRFELRGDEQNRVDCWEDGRGIGIELSVEADSMLM